MGRLLGRLWVGFTTSLIAFIAYSSQIFVIWPWYGRVLSVDLLTLLVPFNILVGILYYNYYLCVTTNPGGVPKGWEPDFRSGEGYEIKRLTSGPRFCRTCRQYKPPRAHHCRQCDRCVLRMDHHCPWVNNCVGHYNYAHFLRFLFFVDVACSYHLAMVGRRSYIAMNAPYWDQPGLIEFIMIVLNFTTCIPVLMAVGGFSIYHFYCLCSNTTTIEGWEKDKVARLVKRGKIHEVKFPYNLGAKQNIQAVLGDNPLYWCWPKPTLGDGISFKVAPGNDPEAVLTWPPEDPSSYNDHTDFYDDDDSRTIDLPSSPWTYENGSYNPELRPSNAYKRSTKTNSRSKNIGHRSSSNVPPYHPDYNNSGEFVEGIDEFDSASSSDYEGELGHKVRRGSEGYEIKPVDRDEILRRYVMSRGDDAGRYNWYVPETHYTSDEDAMDEDNIPLAETLMHQNPQNTDIIVNT